MLSALLSLLLTQAPAAEPVKLASIGLNRVRVAAALARSFEETLALRLAQTKLARVTTPRDVASLVGVERQKQLLGCAEDSSSCLAELAGALGAEGIITGEIAQVGKGFQLTIKILSPKDGHPLFQSLHRLKNEQEVLEALDRIALDAAKVLTAELRPPAKAVAAPPPAPVEPVEPKPVTSVPPPVLEAQVQPVVPSPRVGPWVVAGLGGAALVGGVILQVAAADDYQKLLDTPGTAPETTANSLHASGTLKQGLGISLMAVGGAAVLGGLIWAAAGVPAQATATSAWFSGEAGGVVVSGAF